LNILSNLLWVFFYSGTFFLLQLVGPVIVVPPVFLQEAVSDIMLKFAGLTDEELAYYRVLTTVTLFVGLKLFVAQLAFLLFV
jgi:hypothetical protein